MATTAYDIIKRPIITEQSMADTEMKRYTFEVAKRSEEHTSELQSPYVISYAVFCLKKIFFNDTATTEIYTLSLHDALPIYDIIKRPIITEQSMADTEMKRYTFEVAKSANKIEIAKAVEQIFGVKVAKVNTLNMQGKLKRMGARPAGRRPSWKKAMVTLTADSKTIEFFEGMV